MAKKTTFFQCNQCGYETSKWLGRCPSCGEWNTMEEHVSVPEPPSGAVRPRAASSSFEPPRVAELKSIPSAREKRTMTGIGELDRVLGGGIVPGSVVLAGGEPGIGKSTLFLQAADALSKKATVLYVSGEESGEQVRYRAERLGLESGMLFLAETQLESILAAAEDKKPDYMVIDSIQTLYRDDVSSAPGSITQVRECAGALARLAKDSRTAVFIIGHVTKGGAIAGPRLLEHLVDTVLYFEGDRYSSFRVLRAVKNRFGSTNEIGVFEMGDGGMREVENPSAAMLTERDRQVSGAAVFCAMEGTRPLLLEVEALVSETSFGNPRRLSTGVDINRISLIIAVLEKKVGLKLYNQDIYTNVGGGIRVVEPALDLAVAAAMISAFRSRPLASDCAFIGEIALTGELRRVSLMEGRLFELYRMGITRAIVPYGNLRNLKAPEGMEIVGARNIGDVLAHLFSEKA